MDRPKGCLDPRCFEFRKYVPPIPNDPRGETSNGIQNTCCQSLMIQDAINATIEAILRGNGGVKPRERLVQQTV